MFFKDLGTSTISVVAPVSVSSSPSRNWLVFHVPDRSIALNVAVDSSMAIKAVKSLHEIRQLVFIMR